jgi:hypothetical protein
VTEPFDIERDLQTLAAELRRLEGEYTMFFAGRLPRPPWETRARVESVFKRWDRSHIEQAGQRFRLSTLQARYAVFTDLWDRGVRAKEEGRPSPFATGSPARPPARDERPPERIVHVAAFRDPVREAEKLESLYTAVMDARREAGEAVVPFHRFAQLVKDQVKTLQAQGSSEVALRVTWREGKVNLTARALRGVPTGREGSREGGEAD